jgi:tetratricopeptide (TPR) repeat protein
MNYEEAIRYFRKAIDIDDNPDAYLYLGYIYRELGDKEKALRYFRDRVRRRSGDDDVYAKEAMRAIRKLLNPGPTVEKNNAQ